jgi:shikimate dehydrogenase
VKRYGLLGYPLGHSLSDYIHNRIFEICGLTQECEYKLYEVNPEELSFKGDSIRALDGFNITIPYKTEIIPYLDRLDESAKVYGAVNCVKVFTHDGKSEHIGYNTDGYGFLKAVKLLGASMTGEAGRPARVLLLGCGGTGRMMAFESIKKGADLTVAIRRDPEEERAAAKLSREISEMTGAFGGKTQQIGKTAALGQAAKMRITYSDSLNIVNDYDLALNATPCGMYPNVDEIPLEPAVLGKVKFLFDAIYNPAPTKLMTEAKKRGVKTLDGMVMLVYQAVMSEKIWNNIDISDEYVAKIIQECRERLK